MRLMANNYKRKRKKRVKGKETELPLIGELPHVRIEPSKSRENSGTNPDVLETFLVSVWYSWVSPVCISEVFLHFSLSPLMLLLSVGDNLVLRLG